MPSKKRPYRKRGYKRPKRAAGGKRTSVSAGVKSYVNKVIHSNIENKSYQIYNTLDFGSVNESTDMNAYPMTPNNLLWTINQGTGAGARLGNRISTRKVYLSYVLRPMSFDAASNPQMIPTEVQMFLGYVKNNPSNLPAPADINQLFQFGSTTVAPVGTLADLIAVINTDYWVIKKKWIHKLGYANNQGGGALVNQQYNANNDFKLNHVKRMDITKYCPKTVTFNDASAGPTSKGLFFFSQAIFANGTTSITARPAHLEFWVNYVYEDA